MARKKKSPTLPNEVALPAHCGIRDAGKLHAELVALLEAEGPVVVDMQALERIDTASVQLLAAFVREREARSLTVEWRGGSAVMTNALSLLGLDAAHGFTGLGS